MKQNYFLLPSTTLKNFLLTLSFLVLSLQGSAQATYSTFLSGLSNTAAMAKDNSGNLYLANSPAGTIDKYNASGILLTTFTGLTTPTGIAFDASGNMYVTQKDATNIVKIDGSGSIIATISLFGDINSPAGICVDASNNIYVKSIFPSKIVKIKPGNVKEFIGISSGASYSMATGTDGKIYFKEANNIKKINTDGTGETTIASNIGGQGMCLDASDNIYVADAFARQIRKIKSTDNSISTIYDNQNMMFNHLIVNNDGHLYFNVSSGTNLYKIENTFLSTQSVSKMSFSMLPNPAKDFVTISNLTKGSEVALYDMTGKQLNITKAAGTTVTLNTTAYQNGVYLVKTNGQTSKLIIKK